MCFTTLVRCNEWLFYYNSTHSGGRDSPLIGETVTKCSESSVYINMPHSSLTQHTGSVVVTNDVVVNYSYLNNTGRTSDERGIPTEDVTAKERGWGNMALIFSGMPFFRS